MNTNPSDHANNHDDHLTQPGKVTLIGAGPGDLGLMTVAGLRALKDADVIVFDALANPRLLLEAKQGATLVDVGKRAKHHKMKQDEINALLVEQATQGKHVVRLKGGDPFLFGRGAEEIEFVASHGLAVTAIPGVTSGIAAPATAGVPVTHRHTAATVTFVTGHEDPTKQETGVDYQGLASLIQCGGTVCFYMGVGRLGLIMQALADRGVSQDTPVALVQWGTLPKQRHATGTLATIANNVEAAGLASPAIIVVGRTAGLDLRGMDFFTSRPLFNQRVLITRTRQQASTLREQLDELGADTFEMPTIEIHEPDSWTPTDNALQQAAEGQWDWIVLTSVNGVEAIAKRMAELNMDARDFSKVRFAVIGDATIDALRSELGIRADFVPSRYVSESLVEELAAMDSLAGKRVMLFRADIARPVLPKLLKEHHAVVGMCDIYVTKKPNDVKPEVKQAIEQGEINWVTFTSASTVRNFFELIKGVEVIAAGLKFASIGPITSQALRDCGYEPTVEASQHDVSGLVSAMVKFVNTAG